MELRLQDGSLYFNKKTKLKKIFVCQMRFVSLLLLMHKYPSTQYTKRKEGMGYSH